MPELLPKLDEERQLHQRLLANDPVAHSILAETFFVPLTQWLRQNNSAIRNLDLIETAAEDALLSLIKKSLPFLIRIKIHSSHFSKWLPREILKNLLAKENRLVIGRENWDFVEDSIPDRNSIEPTEENPDSVEGPG